VGPITLSPPFPFFGRFGLLILIISSPSFYATPLSDLSNSVSCGLVCLVMIAAFSISPRTPSALPNPPRNSRRRLPLFAPFAALLRSKPYRRRCKGQCLLLSGCLLFPKRLSTIQFFGFAQMGLALSFNLPWNSSPIPSCQRLDCPRARFFQITHPPHSVDLTGLLELPSAS